MNIIIVVQVAMWTLFMSATTSLVNLKSDYIDSSKKFLHYDEASVLNFFQLSMGGGQGVEIIKDLIPILNKDNVNYLAYINNNEVGAAITARDLGISIDMLKDTYSLYDAQKDYADIFSTNYTFIDKYSSYIEEDISLEEWKIERDFIPIIIGANLKEIPNGTIINANGLNYKVIGHFKKGTMIHYGGESILLRLDNKIIAPFSEENLLNSFMYENITIFTKDSAEFSKVKSDIGELSNKIGILPMEDVVNETLSGLSREKNLQLIRNFIITMLISCVIIITLVYRINRDRDRIGLMYAFGGTKIDIMRKYVYELLSIISIGLSIGAYIFVKNGELIFAIWLNEYITKNTIIGISAILIISLVTILIAIRKLDKLSPKELIGGFVE